MHLCDVLVRDARSHSCVCYEVVDHDDRFVDRFLNVRKTVSVPSELVREA